MDQLTLEEPTTVKPKLQLKKGSAAELTPTARKRFMKKVRMGAGPDKTCWDWTGAVGHRTKQDRDMYYGSFRLGTGAYRSVNTNMASWRIFRGEIPAGMFVCHTCDRPICVNPDHLFLGTCKDNVRDAQKKGRLAQRPASDIEEMRMLRVIEKWSYKSIAEKFGIAEPYVVNVCLGHLRVDAGGPICPKGRYYFSQGSTPRKSANR